MLFAGGVLGLALLLLWLFCIIDVVMTPDGECRYLPKLLWLAIVVLLGDIGAAVWLLVGRPWPGGSPLDRVLGRARAGSPLEQPTPASPGSDRPGRSAPPNPDDDETFLAHVRERAAAQRRTEAERRRERERAEAAEREQRERREREQPRTDGED